MLLLGRKRGTEAAGTPPAAQARPIPANDRERPMKTRKLLHLIGLGLFCLVVVGVVAAAMPLVSKWLNQGKEKEIVVDNESAMKLVPGKEDTVVLLEETVRGLAIKTAKAEPAKDIRPLKIYGQLAPNVERLVRIRPRFAGEFDLTDVDVKKVPDAKVPTEMRPLQLGDKVHKGDVLAVMWSKDLGQAKSDLVTNLSQLLYDEEYYQSLKKNSAIFSVKSIRDAERAVKQDKIAVDRAERTLRSWDIPDEVIEELKKEAQRPGQRGAAERDRWRQWARYEIKAPFDGIIVEKNGVIQGEYFDPSQASNAPIFQIADYSKLTVYAYPYEEDLAILQKLPAPIRWTIVPKADPNAEPFHGTVELILPNVEPNMKMLILQGKVDNPDQKLRANMSVTVTIDLPAPEDEVIIPTTALVDDGHESIVFVQPNPGKHEYTLQHVAVVRRYQDKVYIKSKASPPQQRTGSKNADNDTRPSQPPAKEEQRGKPQRPAAQALKPGTLVVISGAVELKTALDDLQTELAKEK